MVRSNRIMDQLAEELNFPFKRCGKVLVGNTPEDMEQLERTMKPVSYTHLDVYKRQASLILPPFDHKFIHQLLHRAHPVQPAHVGPAEEQALLHICLLYTSVNLFETAVKHA